MLHLRPEDLTEIDQDLLRDLNRETLEKLAWQAVELARDGPGGDPPVQSAGPEFVEQFAPAVE